MKNIKFILFPLFAVIIVITTIVLIVYLATFNKGVSANSSNWDLFLTLYNGIIITFLTIANIWVFYKLTIAIEDRNENRRIKDKLHESQKILTDLRVKEYVSLKSEINNFFVNSFLKEDTKQYKNIVSSILMRMQNSVLFCCIDCPNKSVLDIPIQQILENITDNMTEANYEQINKAMRIIEYIIFIPLFNESNTLEYIRNNSDGIDPTILGIDNYLKDKIKRNIRY